MSRNEDAKLKELARTDAATAILGGDHATLMKAIQREYEGGRSRDWLFEFCRELSNAAARLAFGAGIATAIAHELSSAEEDDVAETPKSIFGVH